MEQLKFKPQSVILYVGPSNCGKGHFTRNFLIPQLREGLKGIKKRINIQHLSSDDIRRELLGYNPFDDDKDTMPLKNEFDMMQTSEQAFKLLNLKLSAAMSYPINADYIIVDTTGLSRRFRDEMKEMAFKGYYNLTLVVFDYKKRDEYFEYIDKDDSVGLKIVNDQLKRFKEDMSDLNKKNFPDMIKIKTNKFENYSIEIQSFERYSKHFIGTDYEYAVIGDVHGCFDEMVELVELERGKGKKIMFIGDLVDKGPKVREVIEYVYEHMQTDGDLVVKGNHENFIYNYLKGTDSYLLTEESVIKEYFDSIYLLKDDTELTEKFNYIVENSQDFYSNELFIATHAPCKLEVMGKITGKALTAQRNIRYTRRADVKSIEELTYAMENDFAFIKEEARRNYPIHVMGHVNLKHVVNISNKYMIDTGCYKGGRLVSLSVNRHGRAFTHSVESKQPKDESESVELFTKKEGTDLDTLEPREQTRIKFLCKNKVNFISGTMSPADKDIDNNILESLTKGIEYYKNIGAKKIILQPKHMGSRGNIYIAKTNEESYMVSRNGYTVRRDAITPEMLNPILDRLRIKLFDKFEKPLKMIILDAEILPWYSMGKGLITEQFIPVAVAVKTELEMLKSTGFEEMLAGIENSPEYQAYRSEYKQSTKELMSEKYTNAKERTFRNYNGYTHVPIAEAMDKIAEYTEQVHLFGDKDIPFDIEPFAILKVVYEDDTEKLFEKESNIEMFAMVSDATYGVIDFDLGNDINVYENNKLVDTMPVETYYNFITFYKEMEGVVIKPEIVYTPGVAPYLKVRNNKYLNIVYGYDYKTTKKYNKLITRKGIKRKLNTSIKEFELGMKLLRTPYNNIDENNRPYKELLATMVVEVEKEKDLDPRL